jgi:hypothetical protein
MANWATAYNWMMENEDAARACEQLPVASPDKAKSLDAWIAHARK